MRLDVTNSRELLATIYAVRALDKTLQKMIRVHSKAITLREWRQSLAQRADTRMQQRMLVDTSAVAVSNQNIKLQSANKGRPLSGGLNPKSDWFIPEFGVTPKQITYTRHSRKGGTHRVTRRTGPNLNPRKKTGHVIYPAAREMVPRIASLWVQTVVRTIATALEGKQE